MSTTAVTRAPTPRPAALAWLERITSNFMLRKLAKALFTIWLVTTITFFLVRAMPGNVVDILLQELTAQGVSPDDARNQAAALLNIDLDKPVVLQYFEYLGNVAQGNLGMSYRSRGQAVTGMIAAVLPWTLLSVGLSLLVTFIVGISLGAIMAYKRDTWIDHLISNIAATLDAVSPYLIGLLAILFLSVQWKLIPVMDTRAAYTAGLEPKFTPEFILDVFKHMRMLMLVYVLSSIGSWILQMKSSTVATLGEDYVTVAKARGLTDTRILTAYVGRNATLPLFTRLAISIGFVVGGATLIESLFIYRGVGFLLATALNDRDYPLMQGVFIVITVAVVFANLISDYVYGWLDPRIRVTGGN